MDTIETNKYDINTLREFQFNVVSALYHYGQVFHYQIRNIITLDCLVTDKGKFYFHVFSEILDNGFDIDFIFVEEFSQFLGYTGYFKEHKEETLKALEKIKENKVSQKNALECARILARRHYKNKVVEGLEELKGQLIALPDNTISDITSNAIAEFVRKSSPTGEEDEMEFLGDGVQEYLDNLLHGEPGQPGLDVGLPLFTQGTGGILPGTVTCISARMKSGKTMFSWNLALNVAKQGIPVLYLDMEMQRKTMLNRSLANLSGVTINEIKYKTFTEDPEKVRKVTEAANLFETLPLVWTKASAKNTDQCLAYALRWLVKHVGFYDDGSAKECLLVYDYMKIAGENPSKKDWELLGEMATKIKDFANNNGIPIIVPAQLSREGLIAGSDQIARYVDTVWELRKKTSTESSQDTADLGEYCGNTALIQRHVRDAESWDPSFDYIAVDFVSSLCSFTEKGRRSHFMKFREKPKKQHQEVTVPS